MTIGGELILGIAAAIAAFYGFITGKALGKPIKERAVDPAGYWMYQLVWCVVAFAGFLIATDPGLRR